MGRSPCCEKVGLKKGTWTPEEDQKLLAYIKEHGHGSWRALPAKAGLQRCGKSCRLRWANYLRPDIKRGKFSLQEEKTIIQLHALLGNRWSAIATHLPRRTDNEIKNYWNTHLKKRLTKMGIDPVTHRPKILTLGPEQAKDTANLSHMAQWENARLEAEARLVRESKLVSHSYHQAHRTTSHHPTVPPLSWPQLDVLKAWQGMAWCNSSIESPTSTLNLPENLLPPLPSTVGSVENQSKPSITDEGLNLKEYSSCPSDWKILDNSSDIPGILKEETWNDVEVSNMVYEDNGLMDVLSNILVDNVVNENCEGEFEESKSYWSSMLYNSVNSSALGSACF